MRAYFFRKIYLSLVVFFSLLICYLIIATIWAFANTSVILNELSNKNTISLGLLTQSQIEVILAVEDPNFYNHSGVDIFTHGQGLTTISSSLARDFYLKYQTLEGSAGIFQSLYKSVWNCCKKIDLGRDVMAMVLDFKLSKEQILHYFLSNVYMGKFNNIEVYGLHNAASTYFNKSVQELTQRELIKLVAMMKAPDRYSISSVIKENDASTARWKRIERLINGECSPSGWLDTDYKSCSY